MRNLILSMLVLAPYHHMLGEASTQHNKINQGARKLIGNGEEKKGMARSLD